MKAVVLEGSCKPEEMEIKEVPIPEVKPGWVLVKIKAFGLNHSEILLRQFEIENDYIQKPVIPGIECVGVVVDKSDTRFENGDKVIALMGGMGRSFNGSYAEYALLPEHHVFKVETDLSFQELAAIPETFFTAYGSIFDCMQTKINETVLIKAGTSSLGLASIQLAKALGAKVLTTATNDKNIDLLTSIGANKVYIDKGDNLYNEVMEDFPEGVNEILELVGPKTVRESLKMCSYHGIVCSTGILGGVFTLDNFDPIKDIPNGVYLTGFYSNYPTQEKIGEIMEFINHHHIKPYIGQVYDFQDIAIAHKDMEEHKNTGKSVVIV